MTAPIVFSTCEHGRTRIVCEDCGLISAEQRASNPQPASYTRVEVDTFVPDPLVNTRATFYPAGSLVPTDLLPSQPTKSARAKRKG